MIKGKRGVAISGFLIGLILVSVMSIALFDLYIEFIAGFGLPTPPELNNSLGRGPLSALEQNTSTLTNTQLGSDLSVSTGFFPSGVINTIMILPNFMDVSVSIIRVGLRTLGMPDYVYTAAILILGLFVMFLILTILSRWPW